MHVCKERERERDETATRDVCVFINVAIANKHFIFRIVEFQFLNFIIVLYSVFVFDIFASLILLNDFWLLSFLSVFVASIIKYAYTPIALPLMFYGAILSVM